MAKEEKQGITVKKDQDFSEWYQQVVLKAGLAEYSPVKGCMIIKPIGYAVWQYLQDYFNDRLKKLKVKNAYFPLFIPESFFKKEAAHAEGFKPEVAWLANREEGAERLAVRPTSETIMYDSYSRWIRSHRDLPLRINQWASVVRWDTKQTRLFLRTREFLWQEGHCVYSSEEECKKETHLYLEEYQKLCKELFALPVIPGCKLKSETFPGAQYTTTIESIMPDGRSLQCGTSHNLGQGFAKSFGISFLGEDEESHIPWQNSWGISTRIIGAMIMMHSDDKGLVLPPHVAVNKAVIVPILFDKGSEEIIKVAEDVVKSLKSFDVILDNREGYSPGWKFNEWELKGVPLRIEIGPKDIAAGHVVVVRRDSGKKEMVKLGEIKSRVGEILEEMHNDLFAKASAWLKSAVVNIDKLSDIAKIVNDKKVVAVRFCGSTICEEKINSQVQTMKSLCTPFDQQKNTGNCIACGVECIERTLFGRSY